MDNLDDDSDDEFFLNVCQLLIKQRQDQAEADAKLLAMHQRLMATLIREHDRHEARRQLFIKDPNPEIPTIFIAVQCSNCLTMQVMEKKKKRRNKWKCNFCDEKQSVSKVFFEGTHDKDVEKFAQDFNMSGKLAEESGKEALVSSSEEEIDGPSSSQRKRRRDSENGDDDREGEKQVKVKKRPMEEVPAKQPKEQQNGLNT